MKKLVYCSGPLFCPEEIAVMATIAEVLEVKGFKTFVPHRDGLETYVMKSVNDPRLTNKQFRHINKIIGKAIFALDIYQIIERCDYLVFNMNGRVPDEGGVAETAIAFAAGKPLVIYKNDHRTKFNGNDNSMITGLTFHFSNVTKISHIPAALSDVVQKMEKYGETPYKGQNIPKNMQKVVAFGRNIWKFLHIINFFQLQNPDDYLDRLKQVVSKCEEDDFFNPGY